MEYDGFLNIFERYKGASWISILNTMESTTRYIDLCL